MNEKYNLKALKYIAYLYTHSDSKKGQGEDSHVKYLWDILNVNNSETINVSQLN